MSWFDTSSFSSFAKTALTQAQNLQKSIDRVLEIEDESSGATSSTSAPNKQKSSPSSDGSAKENLTTRKPSSSLSTTSASKSTRKSSSDVNNSKDNDSEGNSFWSSFLGDSFSSSSASTESKPSSRRTAARKLGSRASRTAGRSSNDRKEVASANTLKEKDSYSSSRALKQQKRNEDNLTNTSKSDRHLSPSEETKQVEETNFNLTDDNKNKTNVVKDYRAEKTEYDVQELGVTCTIVKSSNELKSKDSKLVSADKSLKDNSEKLHVNVIGNEDSSLLNNSAITSSGNLRDEKLNTACEEKVPFVKIQDQDCDAETVGSTVVEQSGEISKNALKSVNKTDVVVNSSDAGHFSPSVKSLSADLSESLIDSTDNDAFTNKPLEEGHKGLPGKHKFLEVEPLASSTPNRFLKEQSEKGAKRIHEEMPLDGECSEGLSAITKNESKLPFTELKENQPVSENEAEMFVDAAPTVQNKQSEDGFQTEEVPCEEVQSAGIDRVPSQQPSINSAIPECIEESKKVAVKDYGDNSVDSPEDLKKKIEELQNEVTNLKHVVEVRESKLVLLSKENVDLQETTTILRSQLKQAEDSLKVEDEEIEEVRQEFTLRVAATEKKFQAAAKERDQLKLVLEQTEQSLSSRNERQSEEFTTLLKEKDDQIAQLLEEGEKLSKQELQINNTVKKLRAKEKENETLIKKNSKALEEMTSENTRLDEILKVKEETERKQADAITKLNAYVEKQDEQVSKLKSELDDSAEKIRSMQTALDNAYKQLADLHKDNASKDSAVQEAALSAEMNAKEGLRIAMEKKERQFKKEIETLEFQISDLQTGLRRGEQQANRREDNLRQEIGDLQQRLQEAEVRNQELTESVSHATRPLLRQIENLQNSYGNHTQTWERVERNLTERLNEAQIQLVEAQEKERVATEQTLELNSRVTAVESQLATYRQDKSRLEAALEVERARLDTVEEARSREAARTETLEIKYRKMMEDNNVEKALLEQQLAVEKSKLETEKKRFQNALDEKERSLLRQSSFSAVPPSPSASSELSQDELPEASPHRTHVRQSSSNSVIDGISRGIMGAGTAMVERLQAQVKQKDGEIELLQDEISSLQKTRDSLAEELTSLTSKLEIVEQESKRLADLRMRHAELEQRHNAVLQMYGEKAEQCEELRMDLEDVKSMYKTQIQELLGTSR